MAQAEIKFGANSSPGERAQLSGSRLVNAINEKLGTGQVIVKRAPGLKRAWSASGTFSHCRGMVKVNEETSLVLYDDFVDSVSLVDGVPTATFRGVLSGHDLVTLAINNASTPDIVGVSPERGAFKLSTTGAPADYPDADVGFPISVCNVDGYFFFAYGNGICRASGINTTAINTLDSIVSQARPGGLVRGVGFNGQLYLFGRDFCEVWQNTANPTGFPFSRSTVIQAGLASTYAIAGFEGSFPAVLMWVSPTNIVYRLDGYQPTRISSPDVDRDLQNLTDKSSLRCFAWMNNGHAYFTVKCNEWCWVYDLTTGTWQERQSFGSNTWRAECSLYAFGDWLLGDHDGGAIFNPSNETFDEDGDPLVYDVTSLPVDDFPARQTVARADFMCAPGAGIASSSLPQAVDPTMLISWSDDSGATFGRPVPRSLGKEGEYNRRIVVNRCGRTKAYGRQWRFVVSDPVYVGLMGGVMHDTVQAAF